MNLSATYPHLAVVAEHEPVRLRHTRAGVTSEWCPMMDASIRRTPRKDAPRSTMEYS
jgi:hypothetical protein